jgi:single-strand DNA-binding protein
LSGVPGQGKGSKAMSRGLNRIQIIGNLGRDPEMRYTPSGTPVTEFSVAVNRRRRDAEGQWTDETEWFRVVCWNRLAEISDQMLRKGARVYVEGRLQVRAYLDRMNQPRAVAEIIANDVIVLSSRSDMADIGAEVASSRDWESGSSDLPSEYGGVPGDEEDLGDVPF